ncbi:helix-turn-helix domain-containing protein [Haloechinothrix sp. YIM 98757]|uniref:Helix-turn-helix domain-containing protein n=1 Tax=Haloechinothrix aidingensis TaxID=2752311 RepID=A0A838A6U1_9PSEU|nr:helix-turn-helix domain-containing protein [Haloechinothrix aidingensis]MBA0124137.1 helix-turn-helix domain-containing protein [Haloechinothrix aidingensis]
MSSEGSLTLDRGLALLQAVADAEGEACTVSELATRIDVSRAAVYRLLGPLTERGLVWRDGSKVRLGIGLLRLAGRVLPQLRDAAAPVLRDLAEDTGATAHLSLADADTVQAVAVIEPSWTSFHVAYRVGTRHPVSRGAAGKAITLRQDEGEWVSTVGELQQGAQGVAAPVRGVPGFRASIGVVSLDTLDAETVGPRVVAAAAHLARILS